MEEIQITEENFEQYFRDVRKTAPRKGDVIACYSAVAEFVAGMEKRHIMQLLLMNGKVEAATQIMRKLLFAIEADAIRVPKEIVQDMLAGVSEDQILEKPYKYTVRMHFYADRQHVPDDPHWTIITIANLDNFLSQDNKK